MDFSSALNRARQRATNPSSFLGQVSWATGTNIGMAVTGMVTGLLAARLLGPEGRGELAAIQSWALVIGSLATLGASEAVIYFIGRCPERAGRYLLSAHSLSLLSGIVCAVAGWWLMPWLLGAQSAAVVGAARIFLLIMIPTMGTFIYYEALRAVGIWRSWNLLRLIPNVVWMTMLGCAFFVPQLANAVVLSWLYPAIFLVQMIPAIWLVRRRLSGPFEIQPGLFRPLLGYGLPTMLSVLPHTLNLRMDQMLMAGFLRPEALGLYVAAVAWSGASASIFTAVSQVLFPRLSGLAEQAQQRLVLGRVVRVTILGDVALTALLLAITPWVFPFLFGAGFAPAVPVALVLVIANGFLNLNVILSSGLQGFGKPRKVLQAELTGLCVTIPLLLVLLPRMGSMGAGLASLAAYAVVCLSLANSLRHGVAPTEVHEDVPELTRKDR